MNALNIVESKFPVLVVSFNNCEIHGCHADGYKNNEEALAHRLSQIEAFFRPQMRCRFWYNVDETALTGRAIELITQSVARLKGNIVKIAFIGVGGRKRRFHKTLLNALGDHDFPTAYFADAERAKEWLR